MLKIIIWREKKVPFVMLFPCRGCTDLTVNSAAVTEVKSSAACSLTRPAAPSKSGWTLEYPEDDVW